MPNSGVMSASDYSTNAMLTMINTIGTRRNEIGDVLGSRGV
jgi:hypothetical protein